MGPTGQDIEGRNGVRNSRRGTHLGSGHMRPRHQTGHMSASDPIGLLLSSCKQGAVHIWGPAVLDAAVRRRTEWEDCVEVLPIGMARSAMRSPGPQAKASEARPRDR